MLTCSCTILLMLYESSFVSNKFCYNRLKCVKFLIMHCMTKALYGIIGSPFFISSKTCTLLPHDWHLFHWRFPRPILHGLCTLGFAIKAIIKCVCKGDPTAVKTISGRFLTTVFPGETLITEMWLEGLRYNLLSLSLGNKLHRLPKGIVTSKTWT